MPLVRESVEVKLLRVAAVAAICALCSCHVSNSPDSNAATPVDRPQQEDIIAPILTTADAKDVHSYARPLEARVTHLALDLTVDFASKRIGGTAALDIQRRPDARQIVLDDDGLDIEAVSDSSGQPLDFKVGADDPVLGSPLTIALRGDTANIVIRYKSAADSSALQWLAPTQTAGKHYPFLFSQGESIANRSWIPTQDSPGIRQSWEARIRVPAPLTAVMSAKAVARRQSDGNARIFKYQMDHPVAPYLIAIAVGDLAFQPLGQRTGVWTEPAMMKAAALELADTSKMVDAAEALYGPYRWGRYDVLVLPPSFPYGGMENPTLTFLTPTFIAGDKSLVSLIAHELAHSWSGNLATNATWNDFWLNEGMTTYAERRIVEQLYGRKQAQEQILLGLDALDKAVRDNGGANGPDTRLHLDIGKSRHPDDVTSDIAYEKGAAFLRTIAAIVGRDRFDTWLKGWFDRHAFQPVTSAIFLADIRHNLVKSDKPLEHRLDLDQWVYGTGIPANIVRPDPSVFARVDSAVVAFGSGAAPDSALWAKWNTDERLRFLTHIARKQPAGRLAATDKAFALSASRNTEIRFAWLDLAVANRFAPAIASLRQFLSSQGRGKFVKPLFEALAKDPKWGRKIATDLYPRVRPLYHPMVTRDLDKLMLGG